MSSIFDTITKTISKNIPQQTNNPLLIESSITVPTLLAIFTFIICLALANQFVPFYVFNYLIVFLIFAFCFVLIYTIFTSGRTWYKSSVQTFARLKYFLLLVQIGYLGLAIKKFSDWWKYSPPPVEFDDGFNKAENKAAYIKNRNFREVYAYKCLVNASNMIFNIFVYLFDTDGSLKKAINDASTFDKSSNHFTKKFIDGMYGVDEATINFYNTETGQFISGSSAERGSPVLVPLTDIDQVSKQIEIEFKNSKAAAKANSGNIDRAFIDMQNDIPIDSGSEPDDDGESEVDRLRRENEELRHQLRYADELANAPQSDSSDSEGFYPRIRNGARRFINFVRPSDNRPGLGSEAARQHSNWLSRISTMAFHPFLSTTQKLQAYRLSATAETAKHCFMNFMQQLIFSFLTASAGIYTYFVYVTSALVSPAMSTYIPYHFVFFTSIPVIAFISFSFATTAIYMFCAGQFAHMFLSTAWKVWFKNIYNNFLNHPFVSRMLNKWRSYRLAKKIMLIITVFTTLSLIGYGAKTTYTVYKEKRTKSKLIKIDEIFPNDNLIPASDLTLQLVYGNPENPLVTQISSEKFKNSPIVIKQNSKGDYHEDAHIKIDPKSKQPNQIYHIDDKIVKPTLTTSETMKNNAIISLHHMGQVHVEFSDGSSCGATIIGDRMYIPEHCIVNNAGNNDINATFFVHTTKHYGNDKIPNVEFPFVLNEDGTLMRSKLDRDFLITRVPQKSQSKHNYAASDFRAPASGEIADLIVPTAQPGKVLLSSGYVGKTRKNLDVHNLSHHPDVQEFSGSSLAGFCGSVLHSQTDGKVIGFWGIGSPGTYNFFFPVNSAFIDEIKTALPPKKQNKAKQEPKTTGTLESISEEQREFENDHKYDDYETSAEARGKNKTTMKRMKAQWTKSTTKARNMLRNWYHELYSDNDNYLNECLDKLDYLDGQDLEIEFSRINDKMYNYHLPTEGFYIHNPKDDSDELLYDMDYQKFNSYISKLEPSEQKYQKNIWNMWNNDRSNYAQSSTVVNNTTPQNDNPIITTIHNTPHLSPEICRWIESKFYLSKNNQKNNSEKGKNKTLGNDQQPAHILKDIDMNKNINPNVPPEEQNDYKNPPRGDLNPLGTSSNPSGKPKVSLNKQIKEWIASLPNRPQYSQLVEAIQRVWKDYNQLKTKERIPIEIWKVWVAQVHKPNEEIVKHRDVIRLMSWVDCVKAAQTPTVLPPPQIPHPGTQVNVAQSSTSTSSTQPLPNQTPDPLAVSSQDTQSISSATIVTNTQQA